MTGWAEDLLLGGGYVLLAALILLENLFPPIPSELVMPLAGFTAAFLAVAAWGFRRDEGKTYG